MGPGAKAGTTWIVELAVRFCLLFPINLPTE
jgi:hypothetical protein